MGLGVPVRYLVLVIPKSHITPDTGNEEDIGCHLFYYTIEDTTEA